MKAEETRNVTTLTEELARNADSAALGAEIGVTTRRRTKAELKRESGLMDTVCERGNLMLAYQRVVKNKGAAGVDGIGITEFKDYLKQHWPTIKDRLLSGEYMPQAVRRVDIPKPQGGVRTLGIPTLADRMIQQALHQVLSPIFEADFSASSYGFRPGKNAHQAVKAAQQYVAEGRRIVVDMDLEKFFDRVNHDLLMEKLSKKIDDRRVLRLIRRYLEAGMMAEGSISPRTEGTLAVRALESAAVEHPADRTGSGTGTPGSRLLPLCGRLQHLRQKRGCGRTGHGEHHPVPVGHAQAHGQCGQERGSASVEEEVSGLQHEKLLFRHRHDVAQSPETADRTDQHQTTGRQSPRDAQRCERA